MYNLKVTEEMGRGLYASREIWRGEIIAVCEVLLLSPNDTVAVNQTDLKHYTFKYNDLQDCLVLGDGEIFNHDDNANVSYRLELMGSRYCMVFTALNAIETGAQLFINYGSDVNVNVKNYVDAKSLVG